MAQILGKAQGRQLTSVECCLLIDEAAVTIVAGNIRRSAGMRQFAAEDLSAAGAKENLWQQDSDGNWRIDPERDALPPERPDPFPHIKRFSPDDLLQRRVEISAQLKTLEQERQVIGAS